MQAKIAGMSVLENRKLRIVLPFTLLTIFLVMLGSVAAQNSSVVPTFTIENVVVDQTVTILAQDFPPNQDFVVTMGKNGTLGIDGIVVGSINSGLVGSFQATFPIPTDLQGDERIAMRLESRQGNFSYNWFWNNLSQSQAGSPVPYLTIESVSVNDSVTIRTYNFPSERVFDVRMGQMGTLGIDGTLVGRINSDLGGAFLATFSIPANLKGLERIAIRAESGPYFAYNWFDNQTEPLATPTFRICSVVRDESIVIRTNSSFPANKNFVVMMNQMGTLGEDGYVVGQFNSGPTGVMSGVFPIPSGLRGLDRIAVRTEQVDGPFFSYNYFNNQTAVYCD